MVSPFVRGRCCLAEFNLERFEEAALSFEKAGRLNPDDHFPFLALAATYGHLHRTDEATAAVARYNELTVKQGDIPASEDGGWSDCTTISGIVIERVMTGLRSAGLPKSLARGEFAERHLCDGRTADFGTVARWISGTGRS